MSAAASRTNRSALTNGALLPHGLDGRSAEARRFKDLLRAFRAQLPEPRSVAVDALCRTLAGVTLALERIVAQQARGTACDPAELVSLGNLQSRLLERLGLAPSAAPPEPDSLAAYTAKTGIKL